MSEYDDVIREEEVPLEEVLLNPNKEYTVKFKNLSITSTANFEVLSSVSNVFKSNEESSENNSVVITDDSITACLQKDNT